MNNENKALKISLFCIMVVMLVSILPVNKAEALTVDGSYSTLSIRGEWNSASSTIYNNQSSVSRYVTTMCIAYDANSYSLGSDTVDGIISSGARTALLVGLKGVDKVFGTGTIYNGTSAGSPLETLSKTLYLSSRKKILSPQLKMLKTQYK